MSNQPGDRILNELRDVRAALDESSIVSATDKNGLITFVNVRFCEISGYQPEELIGQTHGIINSGLHSKDFFRDLWETIRKGKTWRGEICNRARDGSIFWVLTTIVPFLDEHGTPLQFIGIHHDITTQKRTEEKLTASLEQLRKLEDDLRVQNEELISSREVLEKAFAASPNGILIIRLADKKIVKVNEVGARLFGYSPVKMIGEDYVSLNLFAEAADHERFLRILARDNRVRELEARIIKFPGEFRHAVFSCEKVLIEGVESLLMVIRDVTDHQRVEEKLWDSEQKMRLVLDASRIGIWVSDVVGDRTVWSPENCRIFGIEAFDGFGETFWKMVHPSDHDRVYEKFQECIADGTYYDAEFRIVRPDGVVRWVRGSGTCQYDENGAPTRFLGSNLDITENKLAQEKLLASEERMRLVLNAAKIGIWIFDLQTNHIYWSPEHFELFHTHQFDGTLEGLQKFIHPDDAKNVLRHINDSIENKSTYEPEFRILCPDGEVRWIGSLGHAEYDAKGRPFRFMSAVFDITERKKREEQHRLYEKVIVNARDSILITEAEPIDGAGPRIVYANPAFTAMTGYKLEEIIGQTPRILQGPKTDRSKLDRIRESMSHWKPIQASMTNYRKDRTEFEVEFDVVPVADETGAFTHWISIQRDITERKNIEQLIKEKNQLLEQSYDAIFIWNIDDGIIYWHANSERLFGYPEAEAIGCEAHELLKTVYPSSFREFVAELRKSGYWEGETVHLTKSKTEVIAEARLQVIRKTDDNLIVLETLRDVTDRRRIDSNLARASQLALIGELAAGLAHEIKNPLAGIKGVIDILLLNQDKKDDEDVEILENVRHQIDRIDKTVRALLQHARPRPVEIKPFPLEETIRRTVRFAALQTSIKHSRGPMVPIELLLPDASLIVPHDSAGIEDAVLNLIINARDAIAEKAKGHISVSLKLSETASNPGEALIEVTDNGCGIPTDRLERIFSPFQSSKENGTGLGLASVRRIARAHDGECEVRSKVRKGTTVTIRLPMETYED